MFRMMKRRDWWIGLGLMVVGWAILKPIIGFLGLLGLILLAIGGIITAFEAVAAHIEQKTDEHPKSNL